MHPQSQCATGTRAAVADSSAVVRTEARHHAKVALSAARSACARRAIALMMANVLSQQVARRGLLAHAPSLDASHHVAMSNVKMASACAKQVLALSMAFAQRLVKRTLVELALGSAARAHATLCVNMESACAGVAIAAFKVHVKMANMSRTCLPWQ